MRGVEAVYNAGQIGRAAALAYEQNKQLCASSTYTVPASIAQVRGVKYQSTPEEWQKDAAANAGFACLKIEIRQAQAFMYSYIATTDGFVVTAQGDEAGNGKYSRFEIRGTIDNGKLTLSGDPAVKYPADERRARRRGDAATRRPTMHASTGYAPGASRGPPRGEPRTWSSWRRATCAHALGCSSASNDGLQAIRVTTSRRGLAAQLPRRT